MKTGFKNITRLVGVLLLTAVIVQGCSDVADSNKENSSVLSEEIEIDANVQFYMDGVSSIYYGRDRTKLGRVSYERVGDNIEFTFETEEAWPFSEIHIWVGNNKMEYPQNKKGIPQIGHFPYNSDKDNNFNPQQNADGMWEYTVYYPVNGSGGFQALNTGTATYMIIHVVSKDETAFAGCWSSDNDPEIKSPRWFNWVLWYDTPDGDFRLCPGEFSEPDATP